MDSLNPVGMVDQSVAAAAADRLRAFRGALYGCLGRRADELFELTDALLCTEGPVCSLVGLCLAPEHRRGHGALYDAVNVGRVDSAGSMSRGCAGCWPACRCRGCSAGGSCWRAMPPPGCARTPRPARSGGSATSTAAAGSPIS